MAEIRRESEASDRAVQDGVKQSISGIKREDLARGGFGEFLVSRFKGLLSRREDEDIDRIDFEAALDDVGEGSTVVVRVVIAGIGQKNDGFSGARLPIEAVHGEKDSRERRLV